MSMLLDQIGMLAREEDRDLAAYAGEVPQISEAAKLRLIEQILKAQAAAQESGAVRRPSVTVELGGVADLVRPRRQPAPRRGVLAFSAAGIAVACAAALMIWLRTGHEDAGGLPMYAVSATGGVVMLRGGSGSGSGSEGGEGTATDGTTTSLQRVRSETELRIVCRPYTAATGGSLAVRAFLVQGSSVNEVHPAIQIAASGAAELRVNGADLVQRNRGYGDLRVVIGREAAIRAVELAEAEAGDQPSHRRSGREPAAGTEPNDRRWLSVPVDLEGP